MMLAAIARPKGPDRRANRAAMPRPGTGNAHARSPVLTEKKGELAAAFRTFRGAVVGIGLFSAVSNVLMLTGPLFMLEIYDRVLPSRSVPTLVLLLLLVAMLFAAQGVIDWIRARMMVRIGSALDETLSSRVHQTLVRLALRGGKAEGLEPVRDLDSIRSFLSGLGPTALFDLPWIPLYLCVIFALHPLLGLTALVGSIMLIGLALLAEHLTQAPIKSATAHGKARYDLAEASRRNAEVLAAMGFGHRIGELWRQANRNYVAGQQRASDVAAGFGSVSKVLRLVLQSGALGLGAYLVIRQEASAGVIIASSILTARALAPVDLAIAHWKGYVAARQGWQRLGNLLAILPAAPAHLKLPAPTASVVVDNISMTAPGDTRLIVQGAGFSLKAGQGLGIIGPSASGKSSLARALVGIWPTVRGQIRLDGAALDQWPAEDLGHHVGYLPQDVELFDGTVAQNIARFDPEAPAEAIIAAARAARVHELVVNLRDGYETQVGEQGATLSAGQRQRIALARALYGNPFLVVLDEPNSNLDAEGEAGLTQAIADVRHRNGIVVVIAHRPSALAATDTILVMRQGRVETIGAKANVLRSLIRPSNDSRLANDSHQPLSTAEARQQGARQ